MSPTRLLDGQVVLLAANDEKLVRRRRSELRTYGSHVIAARTCSSAQLEGDLPLTAAVLADDLGRGRVEQFCWFLEGRGIPFVLLGDDVSSELHARYQGGSILTRDCSIDRIVGRLEEVLVNDHVANDSFAPIVLELARTIRRSEERVRRQEVIVRRSRSLRSDHEVAEAMLEEMSRSLRLLREHLANMVRQQAPVIGMDATKFLRDRFG